jgi:hypothetical protein
MKERLGLLGAIDPYTGSYFSKKWIQRNVLRLSDDQIDEMNFEIDDEKEKGMGLPTEVTNQVAQQQMVGQVDAENQIAMQNAMGQDQGGSSSNSSKSKTQSKPQPKGDLSLEDTTFTKLKRIL